MKTKKALILAIAILVVAGSAAFVLARSTNLLGFIQFGNSPIIGNPNLAVAELPWWCTPAYSKPSEWNPYGGSTSYKPTIKIAPIGQVLSPELEVKPNSTVNQFQPETREDYFGFPGGELTRPEEEGFNPNRPEEGDGGGFGGIGTGTPNPDVNESDLPDKKYRGFWHQCDCDEESYFIEELGETFDCPDFGEPIYREKREEGDTIVSIAITKIPEAECDDACKCPDGTVIDWSKIYETCYRSGLAYTQMCAPDDESNDLYDKCVMLMGGGFVSSLERDIQSIEEADCPEEDECDEYEEAFADGVFTDTYPDKDATATSDACREQDRANK